MQSRKRRLDHKSSLKAERLSGKFSLRRFSVSAFRVFPGRIDRGIMLVEAMVAIGILGIGMATLSALMTHHIRTAGTDNLYTTAIALGEQELEDLRSQDYTTGLVSRTTTSTQGITTYTITTTVTADSPAINMKTIATKVTWTGLNGSQTYTLNTIYTQLQN